MLSTPTLALLLAPAAGALLLLLQWLFEPVVEARRLALEPDLPSENAFEDPSDTDPHTRQCVHLWGVCLIK